MKNIVIAVIAVIVLLGVFVIIRRSQKSIAPLDSNSQTTTQQVSASPASSGADNASLDADLKNLDDSLSKIDTGSDSDF